MSMFLPFYLNFRTKRKKKIYILFTKSYYPYPKSKSKVQRVTYKYLVIAKITKTQLHTTIYMYGI
jgi:hypothetical protein